MRKFSRSAFLGFCIGSLWLAVSGCTSQPTQTADTASTANTKFEPTGTVKDLMQSLVDPSADVVWNSVATVSDEKGIEDRIPRTDEEWADVRHGAIRLVETANLLLIPGREVMRSHEKSEAPGVELEGPEIQALINKDRGAWEKRVKALHDAGLLALKAADDRDPKELLEVGEQIEHACEGCHTHYWYPNQQLPPGYGEQ